MGKLSVLNLSAERWRVPAWLAEAGRASGELFEDVCIGWRSEKFHFNRARSFARYQDSLVRAIGWLKFEEMEPLADWFAEPLTEVVRGKGTALEADLIVAAPLHKVRQRERGLSAC